MGPRRGPTHDVGAERRLLREGGGRLQQQDGHFLAVAFAPQNLDDAASHEEKRRPGRPLLVDGFAVPVAPLVRGAGEPRQLRPAEILEESDLGQKIDEVAASLARGHSRHRPESGERRNFRGVR